MRITFACLLALLACLAGPVLAHDPGLSSVTLDMKPGAIEATILFNQSDFAGLVQESRQNPDSVASGAVELTVDGQVLDHQIVALEKDTNKNFAIREKFLYRPGTTLRVESKLLEALPFGHRQILTVQDVNGKVTTQKILNANENSLEMSCAAFKTVDLTRNNFRSFQEFFTMGVEHIATGYDHILFLFGLLLVCPGFWSTARIITCFTIAHSITLALSTLNVVQMPSRVVEAMIAASIVYVGIENVVSRGNVRWREILAFAFGLVHGLGFASALRDVGVGSNGLGVIIPLISFNFGVETGQLIIASLFLPIIWKLRERPLFLSQGIPACSCLVAGLGAYWFLARTIFT